MSFVRIHLHISIKKTVQMYTFFSKTKKKSELRDLFEFIYNFSREFAALL
jgi:hypothetical protein